MEEYRVWGGHPLEGTVELPPAKNSVLPLLAASLLCCEPVTLREVPRLADVATSLTLLESIGAFARWEGQDVVITPPEEWQQEIPREQAAAMRSSVFYLAPILVRTGRVTMPLPGGCRLGPRPIDLHLDGLIRMGAQVHWHGGAVTVERCRPLKGVDYTLRLPSVGATETLMMAAAGAQGCTVLRGVACEPEVEDLAGFLNACGVRVQGAGSPEIRIQGRSEISGCRWKAGADRIAASTFGAAVAIAGGQVTLRGCPAEHWEPFLRFLSRVGCGVRGQDGEQTIERSRPLRGEDMRLATAGYPGFATDAAPLAAAVLLGVEDTSVVTDTLFTNRFACADGFSAMGAAVHRQGQSLCIRGGHPLHGTQVTAPDLRGGAALLLTGLGAKGCTTVRDDGHIRRGYVNLAQQLAEIGAEIG